MRPKILTVDDAKSVRRLVQTLLSPFDCDLSEAANGFNALFAMERTLPDLIILDVNMPVMGGLEMLTLMRSNPILEKIPVIMMTSPTDHAILGQITTLGVSATLVKPFKDTVLLENIRRVLPLKPSSPASR